MGYQCIYLRQKGPLHEVVHHDRLFAQSLTSSEIGLHFYDTYGVILGKLDKTTANFDQGVAFLHDQGYPTTIREQGGLAVVVDHHVLNFSIILPLSLKPFSGLYESYELMGTILNDALATYRVQFDFYEIEHSYCPGAYDGVLEGKKWCGLAQKRMKDKVIVSATLMIDGDQNQRGELMKQFYDIANTNHDERFPDIIPSCMTTLNTHLEEPVTLDEVTRLIYIATQAWAQRL